MTMKSELDTFYMLFKQHLNGAQKATLRWVTCKDVNWDEGTMTAIDEDGLAYHDVMLGNNAVLIKPVENTDCLIGIIHGHESEAFLISANEVEEVVYIGGENGGFCKTVELKAQLQKQSKRIDGIIDALNNAKTATDYSGAALLASIVAGLKLITDKEDFSKIESDKLKH